LATWFGIEETGQRRHDRLVAMSDVESVPDRCGGAWVVRGTRIPVERILDNAGDCTPEQIAGPDIFPSLTVKQVRRVLRFAYQAQIDIIYEQRRCPLFPRDYELDNRDTARKTRCDPG
jgi:uncharacterized protein (DUF433 family)